ncbi:urea carboxylase [Xylaria venustula]|nr:urea carboxylase [Xylaria venustula]
MLSTVFTTSSPPKNEKNYDQVSHSSWSLTLDILYLATKTIMDYPRLANIKRVLVANRGEIAVRCIRTARDLGVTSIAIYTSSDATSLHVALADEAVQLSTDGVPGYLDIHDILRICCDHSVDAVIPGYGFLSENATFAQSIIDAGMTFVGPSPKSITEMGLKHRAREIAYTAKIPIIPGSDLLTSEDETLSAAENIGYPVMFKATGGGGGMGLQICHSVEEVRRAFAMVPNSAEKLFKNSGVFLEKYYPQSRHIEVQVFGNGNEIIHFGERECSIQRRHQKVIEECPSPYVEFHPGLRHKLTKCATSYASTLNYRSAGTVEFLVDDITGDHFFLEMNTRLQVEHGITELCYGIDLVALMLRQADFERGGHDGIPQAELSALQMIIPSGAAIEARIYAEDPYRDFAPSPGLFQEVRWPSTEEARVDTWIQRGQNVSSYYDPLLAKVMIHAPSREQAVGKMSRVCSSGVVLKGPPINLDLIQSIIASDAFFRGRTLTNFIDAHFSYKPCGIDIISAASTIQDFPARSSIGYGIPKSGPMDSISSRIANILVGNEVGTEVLEMTLIGPELLFTSPSKIAICGAKCEVKIDGKECPMWSSLFIGAGQILKVGTITGSGCRMYLAVKGGFPNIPSIFGSKSTTPSLKYGGHQGRPLRAGDFLHLQTNEPEILKKIDDFELPLHMVPDLSVKEVYTLQGPHDSDDIMTTEDKDMLYGTNWKVGHNSSRSGIRLLGPAPKWARKSGGEAGSHPSNYLDYGYPSPGGMNWGGDSACILTADSPNLGGLICSSAVISADLWKLGQLKPGDTFVLSPVSLEDAVMQIQRIETYLSVIKQTVSSSTVSPYAFPNSIPRANIVPNGAILKVVRAPDQSRPKITYRQGGDKYLLIEMGEQSTDVRIIGHVKLLIDNLQSQVNKKLLFTSHISSVMIEYDPLEITQQSLINRVDEILSRIAAAVSPPINCREVRLPLVMDHPEIERCIRRYMDTTRNKAVYLPDNLNYIAKCNGLSSRREVFDMILQTEFIVPAVGFFCGTPMFFPLTPKALTCQKYNPTRAFTPGGTIGYGGSIMAGYSIEAPGGYMIAARTLEMWDTFGTKPGFTAEQPWLLKPFDKVRFFEVSVKEYDSLARDYFAGKYKWVISQSTFDIQEACEILQQAQGDPDIVEFKRRQREALQEQEKIENSLYAEWAAEVASSQAPRDEGMTAQSDDTVTIPSPMAASLWKIEVQVGDTIKEGQVVAILEAMKMEVKVLAPREANGCRIWRIAKELQSIVNAGDVIFILSKP